MDYTLWLYKFQNSLKIFQSSKLDAKTQKQRIKYYNNMIKQLKKSMNEKKKCFIVENDIHRYKRFNIITSEN